MNTHPKVDDYIDSAPEYAIPILIHVRQLAHETSTQLKETIKWGMPHFEYKGIVFGMAAHKKHFSLIFKKGELLKDHQDLLKGIGKTSMGQFDKITALDDLPPDEILKDFILQAIELNEKGIKPPKKTKKAIEFNLPQELKIALENDPEALNAFMDFSPSKKKEYCEWIAEAKTEKTRSKRLEQGLGWIKEGKPLNWKYMKEWKNC